MSFYILHKFHAHGSSNYYYSSLIYRSYWQSDGHFSHCILGGIFCDISLSVSCPITHLSLASFLWDIEQQYSGVSSVAMLFVKRIFIKIYEKINHT